MRRYWWLYLIALVMLLTIGALTYQHETASKENLSIEEKVAEEIDSIIGCVQLNVRQNDSILNKLQDQLRIDSLNNQELRGIRREIIKSNKRNSK